MSRILFGALLFFVSALPLRATGVGSVSVQGNELEAEIDVSGLFSASLQITFEQVVGLNDNALEISATEVNPMDPAVLGRLADPSNILPLGQFPVIISVKPSPNSALSFSGLVSIELSTSNVAFNPTFRLFKSPGGGAFADITNFSGIGSYRVRGASGEFSDFILITDLRPAAVVIEEKFDQLQLVMDNYGSQIESAVLSSLQAKLNSARQSWDQGLTVEAVADLEAFAEEVKANQGSNIPDLYRANDFNTVNVAGALRSGAATLVFSIRVS